MAMGVTSLIMVISMLDNILMENHKALVNTSGLMALLTQGTLRKA